MLRKFFHVGVEENNVAGVGGGDDVGSQPTSLTGLTDDDAGFADLEARLDVFDGRLQGMIILLSRQCQAITDVMEASRAMASSAHLLCKAQDVDQVAVDEGDEDAPVIREINDFRLACITPLQTVRATIPPLKVRCDHRHSAQSVVIRYERKIAEIRAGRRIDKGRERRNQVKLDAALERFHEIDADLRADIAALLNKHISDIVGDSVESLLMGAQELASQVLKTRSESLRSKLERSRTLVSIQAKAAASPKLHSDKPQLVSSDKADAICPAEVTTRSETAKPADAKGVVIMPKHVLSDKHSLRPPKKHTYGTQTWNLHRHIKDSMASGLDLIECVKLPDGYQLHDWVAVHVIDFFNEITLLYGTVSEFCTAETCPQMSAGPCYTYLWADGVQQVAPVTLSAPEYVDRLVKWVEVQLDDPSLFPTGVGTPTMSPADAATMLAAARNILKRLFRVYAHMYHSHLPTFAALHAESHLHFCYKRFVLFVTEFALVEPKELNALRKLTSSLLA